VTRAGAGKRLRANTPNGSAARRVLAPTAVGASIFFAYLATALHRAQQPTGTDAAAALLSAWKLALHGTLALPEYDGVTPWIHEVNGQVVSDRMAGVILFGVPFYRLLGRADTPTLYPAAVAAAAGTAAAMALLFILLRRMVGGRVALAGTLLAAFGTATWTISGAALWPHGPDQLWLVAAMLALASSRWWAAGLAYAAAVLTRPHLAVAAAVGGIWSGVSRRSLRPIWQVGAASLLGVAGLMVYNTVAFGGPTQLVGVWADADDTVGGLTPARLAENVAGTFLSPSRGVLVLSPFLVMLLPGAVSAWRVAPTWVRASAAGGASYLAVHMVGNYFAGGLAFYSYRYPIEALTLAAPLLVLCWVTWTSARPWRRVAFATLAWFAVFQHAVGAITYPYAYSSIEFQGYAAWEHYLLIDGLRLGTPLTYAALVLVSVAAAWAVWRLGRARPASAEESAQAGDDGVPAPALLDPLPAALAHPLGERRVEQERGEPVRDG
jgi:hypothetical protein